MPSAHLWGFDRRPEDPGVYYYSGGNVLFRGVSYLVSEESIPINHPVYERSQALRGKSLAAVA